MFNPKQRLEQIRRNKTAKQETSSFLAENSNPVPLFPETKPQIDSSQDLLVRLTKLQNTVAQLSGQLNNSNELVNSLRRQNSQLETKVLKLEYENSQLKVSSRAGTDRAHYSNGKINQNSSSKLNYNNNQDVEGKKVESPIQKETSEVFSPQVEETLEQIRRQPLENILKRKQQNFRALKADQKQMTTGNKYLKQFANICKDYGKTIKKPVLVLKLQSQDFE